jgi:hypothetical protein
MVSRTHFLTEFDLHLVDVTYVPMGLKCIDWCSGSFIAFAMRNMVALRLIFENSKDMGLHI